MEREGTKQTDDAADNTDLKESLIMSPWTSHAGSRVL